jgi:hypothetical protein
MDMRSTTGWRARTERVVYKAPRVGGALIDEQLWLYDYRDAYEVVVTASPADVYAALMRLDFLRLRMLRTLFVMRELPERVWRWSTRSERKPEPRRVTLSDLTRMGAFVVLGERPGREIVFGAVGRPWRRDYGPIHIAPEAFMTFSGADCAKIAWSWIVKPIGSGQSLLIVEWRTALTTGAARAHFRRYWWLVARGVRLIARSALVRIKAECEARAAG